MGDLFWFWLVVALMPLAVFIFKLAFSVWWGLVKFAILWCLGAMDEEHIE